MATVAGRMFRAVLLGRSSPSVCLQTSKLSTFSSGTSKKQKYLFTTLGVVTGGIGGLWFALEQSVSASDHGAHPAKQHWGHTGVLRSLDHASIRRGYEVYKQVCAACHSMQYLCYRHLVGVSHTESEAKAEAAEAMINDGPDDTGNYYKRPGILSDCFPSPYDNEQAARAANNGAYPPDLSYIVSARKGGENYIFALLMGYMDPPAGVTINEGQYYNPYFPGGAISMAQALYNEAMEYSDGTPATASQLAKDVCTFLKWASEPEFDERMRLGIKLAIIFAIITPVTYYLYRFKWSGIKTRKIVYKPPKE